MATPAWKGPWFSSDSPWNTPIPSTWASHVHPDNSSMVQDYYIGTDYTTYDVHAFAYRADQLTIKGDPNPSRDQKWCGPGGIENIVFAPSTQPLITVWRDTPTYKASSMQVPLPYNWTGYNSPTAKWPTPYERRTVIICENGDLYYMSKPTPPGDPIPGNPVAGGTDTDWHTEVVWKDQYGGWQGGLPGWGQGGSGFPPLAGSITAYDILNTPTGGHYKHAIAFNCSWAADGSYAGHPKFLWPAPYIAHGGLHPLTDGKTKTAVGIPHGGRIFLDPTLTDSDLIALGITKEWMLQIARTLQVYGGMSKESVGGQGGAGGLIAETVESVAWNKSQGIYPSSFNMPWIADGTTAGDIQLSTYNAAFPATAVPTSGSHWKVMNWNDSVPGITVPGTSGGGGGGGGGAAAYVKEVGHNTSGSGTTFTITVANAPAAGNLLSLKVGWSSGTVTLNSVTDSRGNTWVVDVATPSNAAGRSCALASTVQNAATLAAGDTIVLHYSATVNHTSAVVDEFSGCTNTVDQSTTASTATGTSRDAGTMATTTNANDLIVAVFMGNGTETTFTAGSGYTAPTTSFYTTTNASIDFEYKIVSATGAYHPTGTGASMAGTLGATAAYMASSSSGPTNLTPPDLSGIAVVGQVLSTTNGVWSDDGSPTFTYQWQRDNTGGGTYSNIASATSSTYTLVTADGNCNIVCVVTDTDSTGATPAISTSLGPIDPTPGPPVNNTAPAVTGTATVGSTLSCSTGSWTSSGTPTYTYQWQSITLNVADDIDGATSSTYTLTAAEDGTLVQCVVTDTDSLGATAAPSNSVAVTYPAAANTVAPTASGSAQVGATVFVNVGTWTPDGAETFTYQWQDSANGTTGWANIVGATSSTYVIGAAEQGKFLRCVVTGVTDGG